MRFTTNNVEYSTNGKWCKIRCTPEHKYYVIHKRKKIYLDTLEYLMYPIFYNDNGKESNLCGYIPTKEYYFNEYIEFDSNNEYVRFWTWEKI